MIKILAHIAFLWQLNLQEQQENEGLKMLRGNRVQ